MFKITGDIVLYFIEIAVFNLTLYLLMLTALRPRSLLDNCVTHVTTYCTYVHVTKCDVEI